jgi:hypothetical protein
VGINSQDAAKEPVSGPGGGETPRSVGPLGYTKTSLIMAGQLDEPLCES